MWMGYVVSLGNNNFNQILTYKHSLLSQFEEAKYLEIASIVPSRYLLTITY